MLEVSKAEFGERLKTLRMRKGVTQLDIATYLGVTDRYYRKYEAGGIDPSGTYLIRLSEYFGVSTDYLLGKSTKEE